MLRKYLPIVRVKLINDENIHNMTICCTYSFRPFSSTHYNAVMMSAMASQITSLAIVYSIVYSGVDQRKQRTSAPLDFVRGIHRWPVNSPHKGPVTRKMFPFDDVIMICYFYFAAQLDYFMVVTSEVAEPPSHGLNLYRRNKYRLCVQYQDRPSPFGETVYCNPGTVGRAVFITRNLYNNYLSISEIKLFGTRKYSDDIHVR